MLLLCSRTLGEERQKKMQTTKHQQSSTPPSEYPDGEGQMGCGDMEHLRSAACLVRRLLRLVPGHAHGEVTQPVLGLGARRKGPPGATH